MNRLFSILLIVAATCAVALAQGADNPPSKGLAPKTENGIGRADVRVRDVEAMFLDIVQALRRVDSRSRLPVPFQFYGLE